ncbi:hypothetical protein [Providencia rettgeri]|uniref:hypothetical protein n=1 Tax=Providencia rettgeri TaxID=587 RepID=UPI00227042D4|nr:hypothetical protein [Providencia rettgeri]MCX9130434.1 hypothetical protein [Providencia rettgeri]
MNSDSASAGTYRMTTLKLSHYLYQRANTWWFRKTIPTTNTRYDMRLSLKLSNCIQLDH